MTAAALSLSQHAALITLGAIAWLGLAFCLAVAIGLSIRAADRREQALGPVVDGSSPEPPAPGLDVLL